MRFNQEMNILSEELKRITKMAGIRQSVIDKNDFQFDQIVESNALSMHDDVMKTSETSTPSLQESPRKDSSAIEKIAQVERNLENNKIFAQLDDKSNDKSNDKSAVEEDFDKSALQEIEAILARPVQLEGSDKTVVRLSFAF